MPGGETQDDGDEPAVGPTRKKRGQRTSGDDGMDTWKPLGNFIQRLNDASQKALECANNLTAESYNSNGKHAMLLETGATQVEGILRNIIRVVGRLYEVAAESKANGHAETVTNWKRVMDKCAVFESDLRVVNAEQENDGSDTR